uniref:Coiled-coil protein 142 C-terminal domain-containing protein n=1 Tax=Petromyzon marinus TaxID=7757 RepID=S4R5D7_PETMA
AECLPLECQQQVQAASSHLHAWLVMRSWDAVFCQALSSAWRDRCAPCADEGACMTTTARLFHQSLLPLQSLLASCDGTTLLPSANGPIALCAIERGLATLQAAFHWLSTKSFHFLASWSLEEVFLVTQGDLRVSAQLCTPAHQRFTRVALMFEGNLPNHRGFSLRPSQALSEETLRLFASDCKKMAQETLEQTMPLGKQWRQAKELAARPTEPNEYALVAVATVVQPVMEALAPLDTHCQVEPAAQVCSALMLAWMEHIVHKKVVFSVQGGLQLKMDFQALRSYLASESCPLAPETRRRVLGLGVFRRAEEAARCLLKQPRR